MPGISSREVNFYQICLSSSQYNTIKYFNYKLKYSNNSILCSQYIIFWNTITYLTLSYKSNITIRKANR